MQYCIIFCLHNSAPQHKVLHKTLWLCPDSLGCIGIVPCGGISDPSYMHIMIQVQLYMYMITHQRLIKQSKATQLHVHQLRWSLSLLCSYSDCPLHMTSTRVSRTDGKRGRGLLSPSLPSLANILQPSFSPK